MVRVMVRDAPVSELAGRDGDLVERLIAALGTGGNADNGWLYDVAAPVAVAIGAPDACPQNSPVDLFKIRERLFELVAAGIDERFLIRAVRNEISQYVSRLANVNDSVDARRAEYRQGIEKALADPTGLGRYRDEHPEFASTTDDELQARLQYLTTVLGPVDADEAAT
jgi:hypothetical protein